MADRPILFSAPMVRAILAGTKTQTRRIAKEFFDKPVDAILKRWPNQRGCPHGEPGNRLWVRETWAAPHAQDGHTPRFMPPTTRVHYAATEDRGGLLWRPSIHMPRWASRITLEVTGVRVERLNDISEADAQAEGCALECMTPTGDDSGSAIHGPGGFKALWESINGASSWGANPWVWVVSFRRA